MWWTFLSKLQTVHVSKTQLQHSPRGIYNTIWHFIWKIKKSGITHLNWPCPKLRKLKIGKHPGCMSLNSSTFLSQLTPEDAIIHKLLPNFPSFVPSWRQSQKLEAKGYFLDLRCIVSRYRHSYFIPTIFFNLRCNLVLLRNVRTRRPILHGDAQTTQWVVD
jgi:hypothetical protein